MAWNRESLVFVFSSKVSGFWDFIPADTLMKFQVLNHVIFLVWPLFFLWPYGKLVSNWTFPDIFAKINRVFIRYRLNPSDFHAFQKMCSWAVLLAADLRTRVDSPALVSLLHTDALTQMRKVVVTERLSNRETSRPQLFSFNRFFDMDLVVIFNYVYLQIVLFLFLAYYCMC